MFVAAKSNFPNRNGCDVGPARSSYNAAFFSVSSPSVRELIGSVNTSAYSDTYPELVEIWECRRLPVVNFACVETQFLNSDLSRFVLIE